MSYLLVLSTIGSKKDASKLAGILLSQKLAACVSISSPVESHYRWKGKPEKAKEFLLMIKTRRSAFRLLEKTIRKHHPYTVPEVIALPFQKGSQAYLDWIRQETIR